MTRTLKKYTADKRARLALPLVGLGAVAAALSGCGGASTNAGGAGAPTLDSGPVVYGLQPAAVTTGAVDQGETSGLTFNVSTTSGSTTTTTTAGALIAGYKYTTVSGAGPLSVYRTNFSTGIPLGFSAGGAYFNVKSTASAVPTNSTGSLVFGTYVSTGTQNSKQIDLNTSSIVLTSPEAPSFSVPLTFDPAFGSGVLSQAEYKTAPFTLPAFMQTTGLHSLHATVADVGSPVQSSATDFVVATVAPTDVALFLQSINVLVPAVAATAATPVVAASVVNTAITPGNTVTIDGGKGIGVYPTGYVGTLADTQGTVVLFTTPGTHTVTETDSKGAVVQTETFTLDPKTTPGTTLLAPPTPDGVPTGIVARIVHVARRAIKH